MCVFRVGGESGSADTVRDPRGFAVKFYTEDGTWDLVGNNTPIFFVRDPMLVIHCHTYCNSIHAVVTDDELTSSPGSPLVRSFDL